MQGMQIFWRLHIYSFSLAPGEICMQLPPAVLMNVLVFACSYIFDFSPNSSNVVLLFLCVCIYRETWVFLMQETALETHLTSKE